jgi:hypothetical protein
MKSWLTTNVLTGITGDLFTGPYKLLLSLKDLLFTFLAECSQVLVEVTLTICQTILFIYDGSSCTFYLLHKANFRLLLPRLMDRKKWTDFVASKIAQCDTYWCLPVGPPEGKGLLKKWTCREFDSSGCDNMTHEWNFPAYQEFLAPQGSLMHSN